MVAPEIDLLATKGMIEGKIMIGDARPQPDLLAREKENRSPLLDSRPAAGITNGLKCLLILFHPDTRFLHTIAAKCLKLIQIQICSARWES